MQRQGTPSRALTIAFDSSEFGESVKRVISRLLELEPGLARRVGEKVLRDIDAGGLNVSLREGPTASFADGALIATCSGLDEIFAAALRTEQVLRSHGGSPGLVE